MSVKITKSSNFNRNLDWKQINNQIRKNTWSASEILKDTSNSIAPIDTGRLRQNVSTVNSSSGSGYKSIVTWLQPYSGERYESNKKNPQTTRWIEKGYDRKKMELMRIQNKNVII